MNARERSEILVSRFRKGSLPYDMEQWAYYAIMNAEKQARAEVLAACITYAASYRDHSLRKEQVNAAQIIIDGLEVLEPAASNLEELLRQARINELKDWPELCNGDHSNSDRHCMYHKRIAELEKARAEEEKS